MKKDGCLSNYKVKCASTQHNTATAEYHLVQERVWIINEFKLQDRLNKVSAKWEGPYKVFAISHPSAYILEDEGG